METPQVVIDLVDRFECNRDAYRSSAYNEAQARHEFIDPFFMALSWKRHRLAQSQEPRVSQRRTKVRRYRTSMIP